MANNTLSSNFRKIDVDQYIKENTEDDCEQPHSLYTGPREEEIMNYINQNKQLEALKILLQFEPGTDKKDVAYDLVSKIMLSVKTSDIARIVSKLDESETDMLMKYIYAGFLSAKSDDNTCTHLLAWHDKVTSICGAVGSIMRVLTDQRFQKRMNEC